MFQYWIFGTKYAMAAFIEIMVGIEAENLLVSAHLQGTLFFKGATMSVAFRTASAREWFVAMRPWAFTAAIVPVCIGTGLAALAGFWNIGLFLLTLTGGVALQAGTNYHNTYGDFMAGVDSLESAKTCPQLVNGTIAPAAMYKAGWIAFGIAALIGCVLALLCGPVILLFAALGITAGYWYTLGNKPYKYAGYGTYLVFFLMGPLMALPAYAIQTGSFSLVPVFASLCISCLVAAILHANDIRDIQHDTDARIRTAAITMGHNGAVTAYKVLTLGAFALLVFAVVAGALPWLCLLAFALFPALQKELRAMKQPEYDFTPLEAWTAKFHFQFGLAVSLGIFFAVLLSLHKG